MPPKKKDGKKKSTISDELGQKPEDLLATYTTFVKKIGLVPNSQVTAALSDDGGMVR